MKNSIFSISLVFLGVLLSSGQETPGSPRDDSSEKTYREFKVRDGCTIDIPNNWVEIPQSILKKRVGDLARELNREAPKCDYAFQPDGLSDWFELPYILITYCNVGKLPEQDFLALRRIEGGIAAYFNELEENSEKSISNPKLEGRFYDDKNQIVYYLVSLFQPGSISTNTIIAIKPTSNGYLQINAYLTKDELPIYQDVVERICQSINLDKNLMYQPPMSIFEKLVRSPYLIFSLLTLIFLPGLAIGIITRNRIRAKKKHQE